ncbi:MAG: orc1/cdc6 family replication initiation protein [Candidatus Aenigmarchaeota archaeon]|nr:orc1/cdc6 family replication initiation protein [Candidatus Aenigmarchaeota archaeon]
MSSSNIFSRYIEQEDIFNDKKTLSSSFIPQRISHRDAELQQMGSILAPVLKGYYPNNIFVYGTCGTGKTICAKFLIAHLQEIIKQSGKGLRSVYVNCKMKKVADTEYRLFAQLLKEMGEVVPDTGLPTDVLYRRFFDRVDSKQSTFIIILDEIDALVKKVGDDFLYNLTRINQELKKSHITIIGITNDLSFRDNLDLRVKSSLSEEEILFKPYNAVQLRDILQERASDGFRSGVVNDSILAKVAALAAQEHGDARRALDLLRVAGELAERAGEAAITERHIDSAQQKLDLDRVTESVRSQPSQSQAVLYAIIKTQEKMEQTARHNSSGWIDKRLLTGDVFDSYLNVCKSNNIKPLTQRRVSDLIGELDMLGIITAKVISKGRYGRTRDISLAVKDESLARVKTLLQERFG